MLAKDFVTDEVIVCAEETAELDHLLAHLPFGYELLWRLRPLSDEERRRAGKGGWLVSRQDDQGHQFDLTSFSLERSARCFAGLMEARGHKQTYSVCPSGELPLPPDRDMAPHLWALVRQDDNGCRFVMKTGPYRSRLEFLAEEFNREPRHKQCFFVEPCTPAAP